MATASLEDDKTLALSNFTSYNSAAYAAIAEIEANGNSTYNKWPRTKWLWDENSMTYLRALSKMQIEVEMSELVTRVVNDATASPTRPQYTLRERSQTVKRSFNYDLF